MNEKCLRAILFHFLLFLILVHHQGKQVQCHVSEARVRTTRVMSRLYRVQLINMLAIMDEDVEPCEDFFAHACGYYNEALSESGTKGSDDNDEVPTTAVPPYLYNYEDRMLFFERNKENFGTTPGRLLADLYDSCKHRKRTDERFGTPLSRWQRLLRVLPFTARNFRFLVEWPLLPNEWQALHSTHTATYLDWMHLAAESAAHGVLTFTRVFFAQNTIYIAAVRGATASESGINCQTLGELQTTLLSLRRRKQTAKQAVEVLAKELHTFCRQLIGELPLNADGDVDGSKEGDNGTTTNSNFFILDLLYKYFQLFFKRLRLSEEQVAEARVIYIDKEQLENTAALIATTQPRILFNFVLWQLYNSLRYDDCYSLTEEFEDILLSEYWNWYIFQTHFSRQVALATYTYHTTRFQQQRRRAALVDEQWERLMLGKLQRSDFNLPRLLSNFAATYLDTANLTAVYSAENFVKSDFYVKLLDLRLCRLRHTFFAPYVDHEDYNSPLYFLRHFVHFTILSLHRPLFHYFATLDYQLWHKSDLLYSSDGHYTAVDCLERQALVHVGVGGAGDSSSTQLSVLEVAEIFRFYRAFHEALRDYNFWLEGESFAFAENAILEHFHLSTKRVLFYAVAQLHCERNNDWYAMLINKSFMNLPEFEHAFECEAEAEMNPVVKCMINHCEDFT